MCTSRFYDISTSVIETTTEKIKLNYDLKKKLISELIIVIFTPMHLFDNFSESFLLRFSLIIRIIINTLITMYKFRLR